MEPKDGLARPPTTGLLPGDEPTGDLAPIVRRSEPDGWSSALPASVRAAGPAACRRYVEFFVATIRNPNTRAAYARAITRFLHECEAAGRSRIDLIDAVTVGVYIERLTRSHARPTVKQHLAAINRLFDWLVTGQVVPVNPATSVRGPTHVVRRGTTPILSAAETRQLLNAIDTRDLSGLRDQALIATMVFTFARVSAALGLAVGDYYAEGKRWWLRLREKGGKVHLIPVHHTAEQYLDEYINSAGLSDQPRAPLFQSLLAGKTLSGRPLGRHHALRMIKRRARRAGLPYSTCCHTFRATGITTYLENGGTLEHAQAIAAHESPRTTKLYDRTDDAVSLDEIERIRI